MRNYLQNLNIVGCTGIWNEGDICRYCIDNLIEHCDKVVLSLDHTTGHTLSIVDEYLKKYPDIVTAKHNTIRPLKDGERIMSRHKQNRGELREEVLKLVKEEHDKRPIDILMFPDSDERFCVDIGKTLEEFWDSTADTLFIRPIEIFFSHYIVVNQGLLSHARIYKYVPEITALPYSQQTYLLPYRLNRNILKRPWRYVHCARLTKENRELRNKLRLGTSSPELKLKRISKPAWELNIDEAWRVVNSEKYLRLGDFLLDEDMKKIPLIL